MAQQPPPPLEPVIIPSNAPPTTANANTTNQTAVCKERKVDISYFKNRDSMTQTEAKKKYGLTDNEIINAIYSGELCFAQRSYRGTFYTRLDSTEVRNLMNKLYPSKLYQIENKANIKLKKSELLKLKREIPHLENEIILKQKELNNKLERKKQLETELGMNNNITHMHSSQAIPTRRLIQSQMHYSQVSQASQASQASRAWQATQNTNNTNNYVMYPYAASQAQPKPHAAATHAAVAAATAAPAYTYQHQPPSYAYGHHTGMANNGYVPMTGNNYTHYTNYNNNNNNNGNDNDDVAGPPSQKRQKMSKASNPFKN